MRIKQAFTLLELMAVVIIVGILAGVGFLNYGPMKENTLDREAQATLRLIRAAEKIYRMEQSEYYPSAGASQSDINTINNDLKLAIPSGDNHNWDYTIKSVLAPQSFCAEADRTVGDKAWSITDAQEEPVVGECP